MGFISSLGGALASPAMLGVGILGNAIGSIYNAYQTDKWSNKNYKAQQEQFEYQKYLNQNQFQMMSEDAMKAGINPLAMTGGNVSSGNYSNVQAPNVDLSNLGSLISTAVNAKTSKDNAQLQSETAKDVANINAESAERQTRMKIEADAKAQETQNQWQSWENEFNRTLQQTEGMKNRQNAIKLAEINANTMMKISQMNVDLQTWLNTIRPLVNNGQEVDGAPTEKINALSKQADLLERQFEELKTRNILDANYKAQLINLQDELKQIQKEATEAGIKQGWINSVSGAVRSIGSLIDSIGGLAKPGY